MGGKYPPALHPEELSTVGQITGWVILRCVFATVTLVPAPFVWADLTYTLSLSGGDVFYERPYRLAAGSVGSVAALSSALGLEADELEEALWLEERVRYKERRVQKADGTQRIVFSPCRLLRRVQGQINSRLFKAGGMLSWPSFVFGSLPNQEVDGNIDFRDYIACARRHAGARSILKVDIKDFFDNVTQPLVEEIFSEVFKYPPPVCEALSNICCYEGHLVQGALTSSYLAALAFHNVEGRVVARLGYKRLTYTRYVDDITVSSANASANFDFAFSIIKEMVESKDLPLNMAKTMVLRASTAPLVVHGLRISSSQPRLQIKELSRIRAAVRRVENLAKEPNYRTAFGYRKDFNRCMGRVNKLARVGHSQHKSLVRRLRAIEPLPSPKDIERIRDMISRLQRDYGTKRNTYWYRARFYTVHERLNILQRTFRGEAKNFRHQMKSLLPS